MTYSTDWPYLHGKPALSGVFKQQADDFIVTENLGYQPSGEGEHIYLWLEKRELNTAFVAEQLARFCQLPLRAVTYAGRKDKHAVTRQWFAVHKPGKHEYDWQQFALPGASVLEAKRHNRKLRVGTHKGNHFDIVLRDCTFTAESEQDVAARIAHIEQQGVPNYFGPQRFGDSRHHPQGGNLHLAELMVAGEAIKNRNKRNLAISALRSWLFNQSVAYRLREQGTPALLPGDACQLAGSQSYFIAEAGDESLAQRLATRDILLTAPLWGKGELPSQGSARQLELAAVADQQASCQTLVDLGMEQQRRALLLFAQNLHWQISDTTLTISFDLPRGAFATSVLRELVQVRQEKQ